MLKKHNIHSKDNRKFHWEHVTTGSYSYRWNALLPERDDVLNNLTIYQVRGAFNLDDSLTGANGVMTVLKIETEDDTGTVLEKDITDGTVNDVVNGQGL